MSLGVCNGDNGINQSCELYCESPGTDNTAMVVGCMV